MKTEQAAFGKRLREGLRQARMSESAKELADLVAAYGGEAVTPQAAHRWLHGQSIPRRQTLRALAELLDVPSEWLLGEGPVKLQRAQGARPLNPRDRMAMDTFSTLPAERRRLVRELIELLARPE